MTLEQMQKAEVAIAAGIKIDDAQNDYFQLSGTPVQDEDGRFDNYDPYPIPYTDLKSVSVGADSEYVYFKFQFFGKFPVEMPSYNGDEIECTEAKVEDFGSSTTSQEPYELHDYVIYGRYLNGRLEKVTPQLDHYAFISTDTKMGNHNKKGMVGGGMGYDYILSAYPLSLFNLKLGDEVTFRAMSETASAKYHHQDIDGAGTSVTSKSGILIKYKLGSSIFENLGEPDK